MSDLKNIENSFIGSKFDDFLNEENILKDCINSAKSNIKNFNLNKNIYIVKGSSGSYDDYNSWNVCGFKLKKNAQKYVNFLNKEFEKIPFIYQIFLEDEEIEIKHNILKNLGIEYKIIQCKTYKIKNYKIKTNKIKTIENLLNLPNNEKDYYYLEYIIPNDKIEEIKKQINGFILYLKEKKGMKNFSKIYDNQVNYCSINGLKYSIDKSIKILD
jgi:hypothetical protein